MRRAEARTSLKARIVVYMCAVLGVGAVVLGLGAWAYARVAARDSYDRLLAVGVIELAENVFVQGGMVTLDPPVGTFAALSGEDLVFYQITDPRGVVVAGAGDLPVEVSPAAWRKGVALVDAVYQDRPVRIAVIGREFDGADVRGWTRIAFAQTIDGRTAMARDLGGKAAGIVLAISLLALTALIVSVGRILTPLTDIEKEIAQRAPDDLSPIAAARPVEVTALVDAIDGFMARLGKRIETMQRFIADAAHQIRTPLAQIDAEIELMDGGAGEPSEESHVRLRRRVADLSRLAGQLLNHAMVIHRRDAAHFAPVDLCAVVRAVSAHVVPLSFEREVSIAVTTDATEVWIDGDMISLREALANLVQNALTHGARSRLSLHVAAEDGEATISVFDDGPGFPPDERDRYCTPFHAGRDSPGSGLGLAIVEEVAAAHGGRLEFSRSAEGFIATLVLPRRR